MTPESTSRIVKEAETRYPYDGGYMAPNLRSGFITGAAYENQYQEKRVEKLIEALEKIKNGTWIKEVDDSEGYMSSNAALTCFAEQILNQYKNKKP